MIKCFLSHSSKDKERYIRIVAENLRTDATLFDEITFEKGMMNIEEIHNALNDTSLFVIFLSEHSLNSDWVREELTYAKEKLDQEQIDRIYPIIIDDKVNYKDERIPEWMREDLNIQLIASPKIAARKINTRLIELAWKHHPKLKERQEIFVGRNDLIKKIEERLDDFDQTYPITLIASGLPSIGRKSLLNYSIKKAGLVKGAYKPIFISLSSQDNIEDFIFKLADSGIYPLSNNEKKSILNDNLQRKIEILKRIICQINNENEKILIEDYGVLVQRDGSIIDWFNDILLSFDNRLLFCIASQFRLNPILYRKYPKIFSVSVKELERPERNGLLNRYSSFQNIRESLSADDMQFFSDLLTGYPEQIFFAVDQIKEQGIISAKKNSHIIQQYSSDKAKVIFDIYKDNEEIKELILLLSKFEFISYEVLFKIVPEEKYFPLLQELITNSICEYIGKVSEYIRLNEVLRDYISRNRFELNAEFNKSIQSYAQNFISNFNDDGFDISGYFLSAKENLLTNSSDAYKFILPSIFISTIKKLYDEDRNYDEAISLANRVLSNERTLHKNTINFVRFLKCQALARKGMNDEFFQEVHKIHDEGEKEFLIGFFYRLRGKTQQSENHLIKSLEYKKFNDPKVRGELIRIYIQNEEYDKAYAYSKENYENRPGNIINANDYFICILMKDDERIHVNELNSIIKKLSIDPSNKAQEVVLSMQARVSFFYKKDHEDSFNIIDKAIAKFPQVTYPLLTKADLAASCRDTKRLQEAIDKLEKLVNKSAQTYRSFIRFKAILLTLTNNMQAALSLIDSELNGLNPISIHKFKEKLKQLFESS